MADSPTSEPSSDNLWPEISKLKKTPIFSKQSEDLTEFLYPLNEAPDFQEPYSDLNLFLSKKIKEEYQDCGLIKKWSIYLQEKLIAKITPEFQKKFPKYKLEVNALHKTWKKIAYYSEQIESQKDALTQEGKLNISFLIKENLKQYFKVKNRSDFYPYQYAYQLAMKISDCVSTLEGVRPLLDQLAKTIWFAQKHLLSAEVIQKTRSPHDEMDKYDKFIIKILLETIHKNPEALPKELETHIEESMQDFQQAPNPAFISALLAEKLYPISSFHVLYSHEQKKAALNFIHKYLLLYKNTSTAFNLSESVKRMAAFYTLASKLPKNLSQDQIDSEHLQPLTTFFSQESRFVSPQTIYESYQETKYLPELNPDQLEMIIWKVLGKKEDLFQNLSYRSGLKIEEEIAGIIIDNPDLGFTSITKIAIQFFKKAQELSQLKQRDKISLWAIQGDLICRWLSLDTENTLLKLICRLKELKGEIENHEIFISEVIQIYLKEHPSQVPYAPQITTRASILYKYAWYALFSSDTESSLDRFLEWHFNRLSHFDDDLLMNKVEEICKKSIAFVPFDKEYCLKLLRRRHDRLKEQIKTQYNERHA